jgi:hypothetical protein
MRFLTLALLIVLSISCVPSKKAASTTPAAINRDAPYLWTDYTTPKTLKISQDFTADELTNITSMSASWTTALEDKKTFFNHESSVVEITNTLSTMDSLLDSTFGIYKTTSWPPSLPGSALAVTQIFGRRFNVGTPDEFINIEHADILVNFDNHQFDTADTGSNYDLRTVVLHELGHFLGLQHKSASSSRNASIMYPSINTAEAKRWPRAIDIADTAEKYDITLDSGGVVNALVNGRKKPVYKVNPQEVGEPIKVLFELHADGECVHKLDGTTLSRHRVKTALKDNF